MNQKIKIAILATTILLSACSSEHTEKNNAPIRNTQTEQGVSENTGIESIESFTKEQAYEFDKLQKIFISITETTSIEDIENAISQNELCYSAAEYNKSGGGKSVRYVLAYTDGAAAQKYADSGDYLEISFDESSNNRIMYSQYVNSASYTGLFYNYGTWFDFSEKDVGPYSGYYVIDAFAKEDGLTIEYSNGNKKYTNYFPYPSAEDVIKALIDHSSTD